MNIKFSPPDISDEEITEVVDALKSGWITTGPKTKRFEKEIAEFCGTKRAACLNSATAGLELILRILGVGPGDEVITSAYTYTASASVINHCGATIVLCDVKKDSYEMDYDLLPTLITDKTKVIIPVDIGGKICDYDRIFKIVNEKKALYHPRTPFMSCFDRIVILADAAHSFGAQKDGIMSGNIADFTSFSFHAVKNLTTAEGGAVTWKSNPLIDDELFYKQLMLWSLHGQNKDALAKNQLGSWEYDISILGQKCNMTDIMASIGLAQLRRYKSLLLRRKEIIALYDANFSKLGIKLLNHYDGDNISTGHLYLTRIPNISVEERNAIIIKMAEAGIATNVHYKPLPMHSAYINIGFDIKNYPAAYDLYHNEITLPLHTLLTDDEVDYVIETYCRIVSEYLK